MAAAWVNLPCSELRLAGDFVVRDFTQWRLFAAEQFSSGNAAAGWDNESKDLITECAGLYLLGGFGKFCKVNRVVCMTECDVELIFL